MQVILDQKSLNSLSHGARMEIANLITGKEPEETKEVPEGPFELTPQFVRSFMRNLSEKTKTVLRYFAQNNGSATVDELLEEIEGEGINDIKGVFSGLTRRIRRLDPDDNSEAYIVDFNEENEEYFVSRPTLNALKSHFGIS